MINELKVRIKTNGYGSLLSNNQFLNPEPASIGSLLKFEGFYA